MKPYTTRTQETICLTNPKDAEDIHSVIVQLGTRCTPGGGQYEDEHETQITNFIGPNWVTLEMIKKELELDY